MIKKFAELINAVAKAGAYEASAGFTYQPEVPACLMDNED
ncbi:MAG: cyclic lactone autoinducer peptide [Clostridia bacterium]|nr:cyclic lactone autoinducer peptide [Clostridia bacterium]